MKKDDQFRSKENYDYDASNLNIQPVECNQHPLILRSLGY